MVPRLQLYEFNDDPRLPAFIHREVMDALGFLLKVAGVYSQGGKYLKTFWERTGAEKIVELCAGSGLPSGQIASQMESEEIPLQLIMTDIRPQRESMEKVAREHPHHLTPYLESVDAGSLPEDLAPYPRLVITGFHHFPPSLARQMIAGSLEKGRGILILEPLTRSVYSMAVFLLSFPLFFLTPFQGRRFFAKALLTWIFPVVPLILLFDGLVSIFRMYKEEELEAFLPSHPEILTEGGTFSYSALGRGFYWMAWRKK